MKQTYTVKGMTCSGCKSSVENHLSKLKHVTGVFVDLNKNQVELNTHVYIANELVQKALPKKFIITSNNKNIDTDIEKSFKEKNTKLKELKPLFLILLYITCAAFFLNYYNWSWSGFMYDYMGLFFVVFSFFKILDLNGFHNAFQMYDPLAKKFSVYARLYPFIEIALSFMFLMRLELNIALWITLLILGITTVGVTRTLLSKKSIQCACLGTALKLPMTEATFIENAVMIIMAALMLVQ